jgi:hypothetical protein
MSVIRSRIYSTNYSVPSTNPCSVAYSTVAYKSDHGPGRQTHYSTSVSTPKDVLDHRSKMLWSSVSTTVDKSKSASAAISPLAVAVRMCDRTLAKAVSVKRNALYADRTVWH